MRTVQRRLREAGVTHRDVVRKLRLDLASRSLAGAKVSQRQLARALGYSGAGRVSSRVQALVGADAGAGARSAAAARPPRRSDASRSLTAGDRWTASRSVALARVRPRGRHWPSFISSEVCGGRDSVSDLEGPGTAQAADRIAEDARSLRARAGSLPALLAAPRRPAARLLEEPHHRRDDAPAAPAGARGRRRGDARQDVRRRADQHHRAPRRAARGAAQPREPPDPGRRPRRDARRERGARST